MTRLRSSFLLLLLFALGAALAGGLSARPSTAEPKIIGGGRGPEVRILRGNTPTAALPGAALNLAAPSPARSDSAARATARRLVDAYGGATAFTLWTGHGERRGMQSITAPARVESRFRDRRAGSRRRVDLFVAGADISFVTGPEGTWQGFLGLVSDLPEREREELRVEEAHDERLILAAADGLLPARLDPGAAAEGEIALVVWGPRGSATRFRADPASGRLRSLEFKDLDPRGQGDAFQVRLFDDWRAFGPARDPFLSPIEGAGPVVARDRIDDLLLAESVIDTLDLGQAFDDSVFARPGAVERTAGPSRRAIVPLVRRGDHDFVELRVGAGPARRFLVDTGAGMTAISLELARELDVAGGDPLEIVGLGGGTEARAALLPAMTVGTFTLAGVRGLVLDLAELRAGLGADLDGILGFSALARYAVTFDFAGGQLELAENATARVPGPGGTRIPFVMVAGQVIVPVRVDGREEAPFLVDSGAWRTFLSPEVGARLDVPADRRLPGIPSAGADGRAIEADAVRVRSLRVGTVEVARPIVLVPAAADAGGNEAWSLVTRSRGVLGADFLRRFRVTIDFPRQEMTLEPARHGAGALPPGAAAAESEPSFSGPGVILGVGSAGEGASGRVRRVLAGSPAEKAGIRVGDRVTAIDGAPTGGVRAEVLRQRLAGPAGSRIRLTVRDSGGRERVVALERALLL
ncbi:MAG: aspartyl protease family protein [Candidatus Eisenbacteria bacterium]